MRQVMFSPPDIRKEDIDAVVEVMKSGWITTARATKEFEKELSQLSGTKKTLAVNSCTSGLEMALRFLGIGRGDEVIVPAYTYTASASVIHHVGAKIVMVDSYEDDYELNIEEVRKNINEKTKAIIAVDIGGRIVDYDGLFKLANEKKDLFRPNNKRQEALSRIAIIGDCAHSVGAIRNGKRSGSFRDFSVYSFHAVKNVTTAEGGAITWTYDDGEDIYRILNMDSLHGQNKDAFEKAQKKSWEYDIIYPGYKCNMPDIVGALGLSQIRRYDEIFNRRHELVKKYDKAFDELGLKYLKHEGDNFMSSAHLYMLDTGLGLEKRNELINELADSGIATNVHYKPLAMMTAYKNLGFDIKDYKNAYKLYTNEITLPLNTVMTDEDIDYVIDVFKDKYRKIR